MLVNSILNENKQKKVKKKWQSILFWLMQIMLEEIFRKGAIKGFASLPDVEKILTTSCLHRKFLSGGNDLCAVLVAQPRHCPFCSVTSRVSTVRDTFSV